MRLCTRFAWASLIALTGFASPASAQVFAFNVDYSVDFGTPSNAYGAGSGQAGFWNNPTLGAPFNLSNIAGTSTAVTINNSAGGNFSFNNAALSGDDAALMNDAIDPGAGPTTFTISGLPAGTYNIYSYAWAPDSAAYRTGISVNGLPVQSIGGAWPGTQEFMTTYALHTVALTAGQDLSIVATV